MKEDFAIMFCGGEIGIDVLQSEREKIINLGNGKK